MVEIGKRAVKAKKELSKISEVKKDQVFDTLRQQLLKHKEDIFRKNQIDLQKATKLQDRILLNEVRIDAMIESIRQIKDLHNPVGETMDMKRLKNGLQVGKRTVPLGVIGIIYEARPNVTLDAFLLCFKTNNACILRGGKEAIESNKVLIKIIKESLVINGLNPDMVQLITDTSRESAYELMKLRGYVDVIIPRGGAGLIQSVIEHATVPVIETGVGNCHVYVDEFADEEKALEICLNAKTHRVTVCNAAETILVHEKIAPTFLPKLHDIMQNVEMYGCTNTLDIIDVNIGTVEDYSKEYLDYKVAIKVVSNYEEAIAHIDMFSTKHSEAIVTENYNRAHEFLDDVDSACVYVNASTRFSDGFEFGLGAEIGISTQKLHARGPMGLEALTTYKYVVLGNGQVRK